MERHSEPTSEHGPSEPVRVVGAGQVGENPDVDLNDANIRTKNRVLLPTTVVGSYSVPEWLERLKTEYYQRRISAQHLAEIHEVAIKAAVKDRELAGIDIVSDGELRRDNDVDYFLALIPGVQIPQRAKTDYFDYYDAEVTRPLPELPGASPGLGLTNGEGPALVVETSGEAAVLPQAAELVAAAGRVVVVGTSSGTARLRPGAFPEKEIDVIGSSCATAEDFRDAIKLVVANRAAITALFSHHFPLARAAEAFEFAMSRPPDAIKIVVTVN